MTSHTPRALPFPAWLVIGYFASLTACRPADTPEPLWVGSGDHVYEWVRDWPKLPDGFDLGPTHGQVRTDRAGNVYVQTNGEHAFCVFSPDGELIRRFGAELAGGLHGLDLVQEPDGEYLYATHIRAGEVYKLSTTGELVWRIGWPEESGLYDDGERYHPTAIAVSERGDLFVGDGYGKSYVLRYDREGNYVGVVCRPGRGAGEVRNPHGLWITKRNDEEFLLVADRENGRVQIFDLDGELRGVWQDGVRRPTFIHPSPDGEIFALADIDGKLTLLDRDGALLAHLGENPDPELRDRNDLLPEQMPPGTFVSPHGVCFAPDGSLYVVEWLQHGRVTKLVPRP